jgi:hypothetical protein
LLGFDRAVDEEKNGNNWGTIKFVPLSFHYFKVPSIPRNSLKLRSSHSFDPHRPPGMTFLLAFHFNVDGTVEEHNQHPQYLQPGVDSPVRSQLGIIVWR